LSEPINRTVPADQVADFTAWASQFQRVAISHADLSSLYRFGDGGLSPLTGPMDRTTYDRVLEEEVIIYNGKKYAWTIPIAVPVAKDQAANLKVGETVALVNDQQQVVASLEIRDIYPWDKAKYIKGVYGTERTDHPGGHMTMDD